MLYFAYGSNLSIKQMEQRCKSAKQLFKATLYDYDFGIFGYGERWKSGGASIYQKKDKKVLGGLFEVTEKDIESLDFYEDYPITYNKIDITVFDDHEKQFRALAYEINKKDVGPLSDLYLSTILLGMDDFNMRTNIISDFLSSRLDDCKQVFISNNNLKLLHLIQNQFDCEIKKNVSIINNFFNNKQEVIIGTMLILKNIKQSLAYIENQIKSSNRILKSVKIDQQFSSCWSYIDQKKQII